MVKHFKGKHEFLSNFYPSAVVYEGLVYQSVECAYQASKSFDNKFRRLLTTIPAKNSGLAKRFGNGPSCKLRADWEDAKGKIMKTLLIRKFSIPHLREFLLNTGNEDIVEGNYWHDNYWGDCYCKNKSGDHPECLSPGKNMLGTLIMEVRSELQSDQAEGGAKF